MSSDELDNLSDAELRCKLLQNGFPNVPVTETTRKVLIKKLKEHMKNKKKAERRQSHHQRATTASTQSPVSPYQTQRQAGSYTAVTATTVAASPRSYSSTLPSPSLVSSSYPADLSSHYHYNVYAMPPRMMDGRPENLQPQQQQPQQQAPHTQPNRIRSTPRMYAPPPILASDSEDDLDHLTYRKRGDSASTYDSSSFSKQQQNKQNHSQMPTTTQHFSVVNRLLSFREKSMMHNNNNNNNNNRKSIGSNSALTRNSGNEIAANRKKAGNVTWARRLVSHLTNRFDLQHGIKQIFIPYLLIGVLVAYLLAIMLMYMLMSPNVHETISENNTEYVKCIEDAEIGDTKRSNDVSCLDKDKLHEALKINKELIMMLQERSKAHHCKDKSQPTALTMREFMHYLHKHPQLTGGVGEGQKLGDNLLTAAQLIKRNPHWNIKVVGGASQTGTSLHDVYFDLIEPHLPWSCTLKRKVHEFFVILGCLVLVSASVGVLYLIGSYFRGRHHDRLVAVENFTTEIINELLYRASLSEAPEEREVIVNHLRDKLVPLNKRSSLLWSWNEALRLLEANDSRIQFSDSMRNGEEFRCIKWVGNVKDMPMPMASMQQSDNRNSPSFRKEWQSPAFNNTNKVLKPPTPCLKIRHMFDASEINHPNLRKIIEDAIREKAGPRCKILDIQLDRESCCVYVRCASEADAGMIHNEINGWWFDKRLVSIKFLKLQRFLERFPNSTNN